MLKKFVLFAFLFQYIFQKTLNIAMYSSPPFLIKNASLTGNDQWSGFNVGKFILKFKIFLKLF